MASKIKHRKQQNEYRERLFLAMKCRDCRVPVTGAYCDNCLEKRRVAARLYRIRKKQKKMNNDLVNEQAPPKPSSGDVWLLVLKDMEERRRHGIEKYGMPVQPFNGRDPLLDAYQEALDLCVYLRQAIEERARGYQ